MPSIASSSPEVLIATAAANTSRIRVGSGGVMLPNHVPLRVVETYRTLNGLNPGRIDLGIGRAGGSDGRTLQALRSVGGEYFAQELAEMLAFEEGNFAPDHPFHPVMVVPERVELPPVYLLGSSGASAQAAGQLGVGYSFAAHFSATPAAPAFAAYRAAFTPTDAFPRPHAIIAAFGAGGADRRGGAVPRPLAGADAGRCSTPARYGSWSRRKRRRRTTTRRMRRASSKGSGRCGSSARPQR